MKISPARFAGVAMVLILALPMFCDQLVLWGDTTQYPPLRGQRTATLALPLPLPTNLPPTLALPLTNGLRLSIEKTVQAGPPMPPVKVHARLRWIHDDYYGVECEQTDILFTANEPIVERTKGGWRIRWK